LFWVRGLATLLLFLYVTEEAGRKYVRDMPWPPAAECNMITNKQTFRVIFYILLVSFITLIREFNADNVGLLLSRAVNNEKAMENY
jgi:hypothetical protein